MVKFSIVIPSYNESLTLKTCIERVQCISSDNLELEIIIVDDASSDNTFQIAQELEKGYSNVLVIKHDVNQGKGAALRSGFKRVTGDFVGIQDADLEYNPQEFLNLLQPLIDDEADVVFGSRFLSGGLHRVLYFWHSVGNRFLTLLSNMFTDLNLTDMETCYKLFKREVIQSIDIKENRFGFEPEIVAKVAAKRLRIYEMGISYKGRTYEEGKKIGVRDGIRAFYCILKYNASRAPLPIQFLIYLFLGGISAVVNLAVFLMMLQIGVPTVYSAPCAFFLAAILNYWLCILLLFRHQARWSNKIEKFIFLILISAIGVFDTLFTMYLIDHLAIIPSTAKIWATLVGLILNFVGRKYFVFPEKKNEPWCPQNEY
jgi:dolichol-phosphate mannosyltransferase